MIPEYRAWHIKDKVMVPVYTIDFANREIVTKLASTKHDEYVKDGAHVCGNCYDFNDDFCSFDDVILMPLTGLKDAYKTPAFAGDIVQAYATRGAYRRDNNFVIRYNSDKGCYIPFNCVFGQDFLVPHSNYHLYWDIMPEGRIIGNEHANPELMGELIC